MNSNTDNLSNVAYIHIRTQLMNSELVPGQKISEPAMAKELGISRTPVREAIQRLQNEGVLQQVPSSGTYVAKSDRVPLIETYEIRLALETMAIRKMTERVKPRELSELKKCAYQMKSIINDMQKKKINEIEGNFLTKFLSADLAFHLCIMKIAGNHMAMKLITDAHMRNRIFGYLCHYRDLQHAKQTLSAHSSIIEAIEDQDSDAAYKLLYDHIELSMKEALEVLDEQYYNTN